MNGLDAVALSKDVVTPQASQATENHEHNEETEDSDSSEKEKDGVNMDNGTKSRAVYSRDNLLSLRESPVAKLWPTILADDYVRNGIWDPEVWHQSSESAKRCASPAEDIKRQIIMEDGIVLSPQRQSFGQGCQIPQSAPERGSQQDRIKSMIPRTDVRERDGRSRLSGRVGRGRTIDFKERVTPLRERNKESNNHRQMGQREREKVERDSWNKKRGAKNADPEWVTFGPSSQFDTIELKGFEKEEATDKPVRKSQPVNGEVTKDLCREKENASQEKERSKDESSEPKTGKVAEESGEEKKTAFDLNQFFMSDTLLPFSAGYDQSSSRFCQFFGPGHPGSNYSSSGSRRSSIAEELMERAGFSSGGPGTPRSPSPLQQFGFTPIVPAPDAKADAEALEDILTRSKLDVKPLLDQVMSANRDAARVKGPVRLEDIEAEVRKSKQKEVPDHDKENMVNTEVEKSAGQTEQNMKAFQMLVQQMKTSGSLPEKAYPPISGLPSYLLPQPPSPKGKSSRRTPSPLQKALRRSPSPTYMLQQAMMQGQLPVPTALSPAQVVPQMNGPNSPLEAFHKSLVKSPQHLFSSPVLQRSVSPLSMVPQQLQGSPVNFNHMSPQSVPPASRIIHKPIPQPAPFNSEPRRRAPDRREVFNSSETTKSATPNKPVHVIDRAFMPTSVLRKYGGLDKTHKESGVARDNKDKSEGVSAGKGDVKDNNVATKLDFALDDVSETRGTGSAQPSSPEKQTGHELPRAREGAAEGTTSPRASILNGPSSPGQPLLGSSVLQKPTAFKPYPASPLLPPGIKSGSHSEPQSPLYTMAQAASSPSRTLKLVSHSAPSTPQRHPHADKAALLPHSGLLPLQVEQALGWVGSNTGPAANSAQGFVKADTRASIEQHVEQRTAQPGITGGGAALSNGVYGVSKPDRDVMHNHVEGVHMGQQLRHGMGPPRNGPPHVIARGPVEPRSSPTGFPRQRMDNFGQRPMPNVVNGRMSPSMMQTAYGSRYQRTPFNSPMSGVPMHPRSGMMQPGMMHQRAVHPAFMRGMSPGGVPGMSPVQHGMPMHVPHGGRFPMMPGQHPPPVYGGRVPMYPSVNPAAMMGSPHVTMGSNARHLHANRVPSPVSAPQQPHSSGNILSQWFSEDLLKQAVPQTSVRPDISRRIMSVEELEQQQQAAVRN